MCRLIQVLLNLGVSLLLLGSRVVSQNPKVLECANGALTTLGENDAVVITSPNFPNNYPNNKRCRWKLKTSVPLTLKVSCDFFDMPDRNRCPDFLKIKNIKYCKQAPSVEDLGQDVIVTFKSDARWNRKGFSCTFSAVATSGGLVGGDPNVCRKETQMLRLSPGDTVYLRSPRFPDNYPRNRECNWNIQSEVPGTQLSLECSDFQLQRRTGRQICADFLSINGEKFCGTSPPPPKDYLGELRISFKSNRNTNDKGFKCEVTNSDYSGPQTTSPPTSTSTTTPTTITTTTPSVLRCGIRRSKKIVGGVEADPNEFPWQAGLASASNTQAVFCGASVLSPTWVLTAAHCADFMVGDESRYSVVLGAHNLQIPEASKKILPVQRVIVHENYNRDTLDSDIALVEIPFIELSNEILPACRPDPSQSYENEDAIVTGWGTTSSGGSTSNVLMRVTVPTMSNAACGSLYNNFITDNMICAGFYDGGKDSCQGDSGGPMVIRNTEGSYEQVGIVSWGRDCALPNSPGVYTRVSNYLAWIDSKIFA